MNDDVMIDKIAELIAENVVITYQLRPDDLVDPRSIRVYSAHGAAVVVLHAIKAAQKE